MNSALQRLLGRLRNTEQSVRDSIAELVQEAGGGDKPGAEGENPSLDLQERAIIANVLRLREITADDVMVPRPDIIAMRSDVSLAEAIAQIRAEGHSRLPVFRDQLAKFPWPVNKTTSVDKCAAAFVDGIEHRKKRVYCPGWVGVFRWLKPFLSTRFGEGPILKTAGGQVTQMDAEVAALGRSVSAHTQQLEKS